MMREKSSWPCRTTCVNTVTDGRMWVYRAWIGPGGGGGGIAENFKYMQTNAGVAEASIISYKLCVKAELKKKVKLF